MNSPSKVNLNDIRGTSIVKYEGNATNRPSGFQNAEGMVISCGDNSSTGGTQQLAIAAMGSEMAQRYYYNGTWHSGTPVSREGMSNCSDCNTFGSGIAFIDSDCANRPEEIIPDGAHFGILLAARNNTITPNGASQVVFDCITGQVPMTRAYNNSTGTGGDGHRCVSTTFGGHNLSKTDVPIPSGTFTSVTIPGLTAGRRLLSIRANGSGKWSKGYSAYMSIPSWNGMSVTNEFGPNACHQQLVTGRASPTDESIVLNVGHDAGSGITCSFYVDFVTFNGNG